MPTPFIVVYDELVSDCEAVEKRLHEQFSGYRVNRGREFFRIPIKEAVKALQQEAKNFPIGKVEESQTAEMLPSLKELYSECLRPDIVSAKIVHLYSVCYLEITRRTNPSLNDEIIERIDLDFITNRGGRMFNLDKSAEENAEIFLEKLDDYSLVMCTPLFTEEACERIDEEYRLIRSVVNHAN